jgi:hypothetical protein
MIRIENIEIVEFRGIRNLTLDLGKKSFGIAGPKWVFSGQVRPTYSARERQ